jgi:sugar lactone lactonase YvrE
LQASLLFKSNNILAEGPLWHAERKSFFWVDIDGKKIQEYSWPDGKTNEWQLDYRVSLVVQPANENNTLVLAVQGGIASFDLETGTFTWLVDIEKEFTMHRTNDGSCDAAGRLWIGTMHSEFEKEKGALYSLEHDLTLTKRLNSVSIPNGIAWSRDGNRMYFTDTPTQTIQSFLFDVASGELKFEKLAITIDKKNGSPDGMCMDEEGMLWIAQWDGFGVYRWNPQTGKMLDKIELPVPQVSSCAFGGENMDQLFITTARENMSEEKIAKYPLSGNVFIAKPGVKGMPVHKFGKQTV